MPKWIDNVSAFTEVLGPAKAPLILPLASVSWGSTESRDEFIRLLTGGVSEGVEPQEEETGTAL